MNAFRMQSTVLVAMLLAQAARAVLIPNVPDVNQPIGSSIGNPGMNACAPASAANIAVYWDQVMAHTNALQVCAGFAGATVADYLFYFMDTDDWGSPSRMNGTVMSPAPGTYNGDIAVGVLEFARWDSVSLFTTPPPSLPAGKLGYDWITGVDSSVGFNWHAAEIDSGRPDIVSFGYWNPLPSGFMAPDDSTGEPIEFYTWGEEVSESHDPPETYNGLDGSEGIGHAVSGVGYLRAADPDGPGPLPTTDWIICHDNWMITGINVAIPWAHWKQTVSVEPSLPPVGVTAGTAVWHVANASPTRALSGRSYDLRGRRAGPARVETVGRVVRVTGAIGGVMRTEIRWAMSQLL